MTIPPAASAETHSTEDMRERPIGVFDSGIGGLTVVREILRQLPNEHVVYFGDSARVPYGGKSAETVTRFSIENTRFLLRRGIKYLVVACNTASALALEALTRRFDVPMIGVITPGAREAVRTSRRRRIGVIGTTGTIGSKAYDRAIAELDPDVEVMGAACPLFVPLAEEGWIDGDVPHRVAENYLAPLRGSGVDTVILGCTHYPILRPVIAEVLGEEIRLVDTAEATVRLVREDLSARGLIRVEGSGDGDCRFFLSDIPLRFREIGGRFLGEEIENLTWVEQSDIPWYER
jgi:glutamate racemase